MLHLIFLFQLHVRKSYFTSGAYCKDKLNVLTKRSIHFTYSNIFFKVKLINFYHTLGRTHYRARYLNIFHAFLHFRSHYSWYLIGARFSVEAYMLKKLANSRKTTFLQRNINILFLQKSNVKEFSPFNVNSQK